MKPGIYDDIDIDEYHANREIVSSSGLKHAKKSTRDFIWYVIFGTETKQHFDFGNAAEVALMDAVEGTNEFENVVAVKPTELWLKEIYNDRPDVERPKNTKEYQSWNKDFERENKGKYIIPDVGTESKDWCDKMVLSCKANPTIWKLLSGTVYQKSLVWMDEDSGVLCKTRPDVCMVKKNVILDIKTTLNASPSGFAKQAANLDYPLQAAMQKEGALATGFMDNVNHYFWLAIEKKPPFNVGLYELSQDDLTYFTDEYKYYLKRCANALKEISNYKEENDIYKFSSYGENADNKHGIITLDIPAWYKGGFI